MAGPTAALPHEARVSGPSGDDPKRDLIRALEAAGPHAAYGQEAACFDRFVGTWDCDYGIHTPEGKVSRFSGQVVFGWVLDGWAMQDIWWSRPPSSAGLERRIGTTVRFFDRKAGLWRVIWMAPSGGTVIQMEGGLVHEAGEPRIVLRGKDPDGSLLRWSFNDLRPGSFTWRGEHSTDGGKTWSMKEEHRMTRPR